MLGLKTANWCRTDYRGLIAECGLEMPQKNFSEYGDARVYVDKTYDTYVIGEIHL